MREAKWAPNRELGSQVREAKHKINIVKSNGYPINIGFLVSTLHCGFAFVWRTAENTGNTFRTTPIKQVLRFWIFLIPKSILWYRQIWNMKHYMEKDDLRVAVACLLKCRIGKFLSFFAIKCASWTSINAGTSNRSPCASIGFDEYASVSSSNSMLERTGSGLVQVIGLYSCLV